MISNIITCFALSFQGAIDLLMTVYKEEFSNLGGYLVDMSRVTLLLSHSFFCLFISFSFFCYPYIPLIFFTNNRCVPMI